MIGALGAEGSTALMVIEGATDAAVFRAYVKHVLVPTLRPGEIVVMDNLSSHKSPEIRPMIQAAGASSCAGPRPVEQRSSIKRFAGP